MPRFLPVLGALAAFEAAGCARDEVTEPSGGGSGYVDSGEDEEVSDFSSNLSSECRVLVAAAEDNPTSDLDLMVVPHRLASAWELDANGESILTYDQDFTVNDEVNPDLAREVSICVEWRVDGEGTFAENSDALRDGPYLYASAETTPGLTNKVNSMVVRGIVLEDANRDNVRLATFGGDLTTLSHQINQNAEENPIIE